MGRDNKQHRLEENMYWAELWKVKPFVLFRWITQADVNVIFCTLVFGSCLIRISTGLQKNLV
jgi:hypothetical protein